MSSIMIPALRRVAAARPAVARVAARGYADAPAAEKLRLNMALPYKALYQNVDVTQVNLSTTSGDLGILANHVPTIQELKAGLIEVIESNGESKKFVVSGGFAVVQPGSELSINAVEAFAIEDLSAESAKSLLAEAQKNLASSDEKLAAEASIEIEVLEAVVPLLK